MTESSAPTDDQLVGRVLTGDEDAFVALVDRYQGRLLRLARTYVRDEGTAEDVVQDTWIGFLRGIERFEGRSEFRTWLFRVLSNRAKTRAVKEARYVPLEQDDDGSSIDDKFDPKGGWRAPPPAWTVTPERMALSDEIRGVVNDTLAAMPAGQRAVVTLRDLEGLDSRDVCNILDISGTNQRVLLHRGRTRIRAALAAHLEP
jgi:RNA polymerase sigma-70 factor (ECF subfamily)